MHYLHYRYEGPRFPGRHSCGRHAGSLIPMHMHTRASRMDRGAPTVVLKSTPLRRVRSKCISRIEHRNESRFIQPDNLAALIIVPSRVCLNSPRPLSPLNIHSLKKEICMCMYHHSPRDSTPFLVHSLQKAPATRTSS